jgi:hypothetical protein
MAMAFPVDSQLAEEALAKAQLSGLSSPTPVPLSMKDGWTPLKPGTSSLFKSQVLAVSLRAGETVEGRQGEVKEAQAGRLEICA